jgi:Spy/CpxP family protein refolding chaperone
MIRQYRYFIIAALVLLVAGTTAAVFAQGPGGLRGRGPGGPGGAGFPLGALNLTDAQREQVRQTTVQHREQTRGLIERLRAAHTAREQAVEAIPLDEGRVRAAMQELAGVEADLAVEQARLHSQLFAILTPEQQAQAQKLRAERQARMKERMGRMQQRLQNRPGRPQA